MMICCMHPMKWKDLIWAKTYSLLIMAIYSVWMANDHNEITDVVAADIDGDDDYDESGLGWDEHTYN